MTDAATARVDAAPRSIEVSLGEAMSACSPAALSELQAWIAAGARPAATAHVFQRGMCLLAGINFVAPVAGGPSLGGQVANGVLLPLTGRILDGDAGGPMLARVKASDRLIEQLREQVRQAGIDRRP